MRIAFLIMGFVFLSAAAFGLYTFFVIEGRADAAREIQGQSAENLKQIVRLARDLAGERMKTGEFTTMSDAWPNSIEDLRTAKEWGDKQPAVARAIDANLANPYTLANPGYEYVKPAGDYPAADTVVLFQLNAEGKRDPSLVVAFADGSVRDAPAALKGTAYEPTGSPETNPTPPKAVDEPATATN